MLILFGCLRPDLSPWGYWNRCTVQYCTVSGCTIPPDNKEIKLESSDQEASPLAGKNTGVVLVPCLRMEVRPYSYFRWCGYFWGPWVSFVMTDEFSVRVTKITSGIDVSWTHSLTFCFWPSLTQCIMAMSSKGCKLDNFESHIPLKLSLQIFTIFIPILLNMNLS